MTEIKNIDELPLNSNSNGTYDFLSKIETLEKNIKKRKKRRK